MDEFDAKLLNLVQQNNRLTAEKLSEHVGLSAAACQKRLKKLRDSGVIAKDISVLSPPAMGQRLKLIVAISMEREQQAVLDLFKQKMLHCPEVMQCYYVTGSTDFIVILTTKDMQEYEAFTKRYFFDNLNIQRFDTNVVMDDVKVSLSVHVEHSTL